MNPTRLLVLVSALIVNFATVRAAERPGVVNELKVTVLSTMLAEGEELGEWGFAALVEVDGRKVLFDTGAKSDVVARNLQTLKLSLSDVPDVVLSHWHNDHVGGFLTLRNEVRKSTPAALSRTHVGAGIFQARFGGPPGVDLNPLPRLRTEYEAAGGRIAEYADAVQLHPGVWLSGPVPRTYPERNWSGRTQVKSRDGQLVDDTVGDDMALILDTKDGLVIITGCAHAGIINIIEHARKVVRPARIHALIGGIHLFNASEETLAWTTGKLREFGVDHFIGAHCTGIETVFRFRTDLGLPRSRCVVGAVGARFELGQGIEPRSIAK